MLYVFLTVQPLEHLGVPAGDVLTVTLESIYSQRLDRHLFPNLGYLCGALAEGHIIPSQTLCRLPRRGLAVVRDRLATPNEALAS